MDTVSEHVREKYVAVGGTRKELAPIHGVDLRSVSSELFDSLSER